MEAAVRESKPDSSGRHCKCSSGTRYYISFRLWDSIVFLMKSILVVSFCICLLFALIITANSSTKKKKKDIRDYSEVDLERLYEQWADEDDKDDDEFERNPPKDGFKFDPSKMTPEEMMKMSKKGKTLMIFAQLKGNPTKSETEKITIRWQQGLLNGNIQTERYLVSDDRVIFLTKDGSYAWDIKDYLIQQPECLEVTFDNQKFPGLKTEL